MKKIFKYFGLLLSVALMGSFTACNILNPAGELEDLGLGIKVVFPTKVVAGQPMTINGSGLSGVSEIVFPNDVKATSFEIVSNDMIRVYAPAGIAAAGGHLIVKTADAQAESPLPLTLGKTVVSGFSVQEGEELEGGSQITIYGTDLEFINAFEILDPDGHPLLVPQEEFYRKGTSNVVITLPKKIFEGSYVAYLHTYDQQTFALPELSYKPASDGGHWETVKTVIWTNDDPDGHGAVNWNGTYRFTYDGNDGNNECIATFAPEIWEKLKSEKFYMRYKVADPASYQIRVTTGWWGTQWLDNDIAPWNMAERIIDNEDGTFSIGVDFAEDPAILETIDEQHLLFTGFGFTPLELYFEEEVWVGGGDGGNAEIDIAAFTLYEDSSASLTYPYYPSWGDNSGKLRIMRGLGDKPIETLGLTTSSKFIVYKEAGTTGQIQFNNPNWTDLQAGCNDWDGSAETIEVPVTEDMLKCINGEVSDGWSDTALILQGDGLTVTKIVIVP